MYRESGEDRWRELRVVRLGSAGSFELAQKRKDFS